MNSFLKWPGGKKWFVTKYSHIFPKSYNYYIEPFLGGGAVFFHIEPKNSILSDSNSELINLYNVMRDYPEKLSMMMIEHNANHSKDYYYKIRSSKFIDSVQNAARFLYLNRTCYNGMHRVNRKGEFNVPIGTKTRCDQDIDKFSKYSEFLQEVDLSSCDFEDSISKAQQNDLVFVDPPYVVATKQNAFINYNDKLFSWGDQKRLLNSLCEAKRRGAIIIATNSDNSQLNEMYLENEFYTQVISRSCVMAANANKRTPIKELLITSFEICDKLGVR